MNRIVKILAYPFKMLCCGLIYLYKFCISPLIPKTCKFLPTCSNYALGAIKEFGVVKGIWLAFKRILKCRPGTRGGVDPVPPNIKGDIKWLI